MALGSFRWFEQGQPSRIALQGHPIYSRLCGCAFAKHHALHGLPRCQSSVSWPSMRFGSSPIQPRGNTELDPRLCISVAHTPRRQALTDEHSCRWQFGRSKPKSTTPSNAYFAQLTTGEGRQGYHVNRTKDCVCEVCTTSTPTSLMREAPLWWMTTFLAFLELGTWELSCKKFLPHLMQVCFWVFPRIIVRVLVPESYCEGFFPKNCSQN